MSRQHLASLRASAPAVLPSLLLCDFGNLEREIRELEDAGVQCLHLDVMDGHFVPNFTYGMTIVSAVREITDLPLDVHLMIDEPQRYIEQFAEAGSDVITVHAEAVDNPREVLTQIRQLGRGAGLALNPDTSLDTFDSCLDCCDLALVMSVPAGFGGQSFRVDSLDKVRTLKQMAADDLLIEIDGGVNATTIADCVEAGADLLVVGSAIFKQESYGAAVQQLTQLVTG